MAKFENITLLGKLQYAVELVEDVCTSAEFQELSESERSRLENIGIALFVVTNEVYNNSNKCNKGS